MKINGYNSRLDTFQAVVGNWLLPKAKIANQKIKNATYLDKNLSKIKEISIPRLKILKSFIIFILYSQKIEIDC